MQTRASRSTEPSGRSAGDGVGAIGMTEWVERGKKNTKGVTSWPYCRPRVCITVDYDMGADMEGVKKGSGEGTSVVVARYFLKPDKLRNQSLQRPSCSVSASTLRGNSNCRICLLSQMSRLDTRVESISSISRPKSPWVVEVIATIQPMIVPS